MKKIVPDLPTLARKGEVRPPKPPFTAREKIVRPRHLACTPAGPIDKQVGPRPCVCAAQ
jgi:hypothetical protein